MLEIGTDMDVKLPANIENIIPKLNEEQLRFLNRIIVERLKLMSRAHHLKEIAKYNIGDIVLFKHHDKQKVGKIIKLHQKLYCSPPIPDLKPKLRFHSIE